MIVRDLIPSQVYSLTNDPHQVRYIKLHGNKSVNTVSWLQVIVHEHSQVVLHGVVAIRNENGDTYVA